MRLITAKSTFWLLSLFSLCTAVPVLAVERMTPSEEETSLQSNAGATYMGADICSSCHEKEYKEFLNSTHARTWVADGNAVATGQGCESCHGPGSLHVDAGGGRGVHIKNPRKDPSACFACHTDKKLEFNLPYHHPVLEGKMGCVDCHDPHGQESKPWTATTLESANEVCFKCHKDKRGPFVFQHEALREGCTACHKVHGSITDKMLISRDLNLCMRCHTQVNTSGVGKEVHGSGDWARGTCWSGGCHVGVHGSNFDDHLFR